LGWDVLPREQFTGRRITKLSDWRETERERERERENMGERVRHYIQREGQKGFPIFKVVARHCSLVLLEAGLKGRLKLSKVRKVKY
jgi:hypothetical protein